MNKKIVLKEIIARLSVEPKCWEEVINEKREICLLITFCNPYSVFLGRSDPHYLQMLGCFNYVFADGILLAHVGHHFNCSVERLSFDGNSLAPYIFSLARKHNKKFYLIGGRQGVAEQAASILSCSCHINIVGCSHGYMDSDEQGLSVIEKVIQSGADIVLCGMGAPKQEEFLLKFRSAEWTGVAFTCGGYLDQVVKANCHQYYPVWVNKLNIRALYRLMKEPKRLFKRYFYEYIPFMVELVRIVSWGSKKGMAQPKRGRGL